ncbi:MAG TPA: carboxyl transferase domain-containing protein, partial [Saprospiraceae bacterium]|nr:carboxyl transferase domain-containing protein [Saprospiraceae bacterium]
MTNEEKELHFNEDHFKLLLSRLQRDVEKIAEGGGSAKAEAQRAQGKMTARDRITYLLDKGQESFEIGTFTGFEMYEEYGGCPAGGVISVIGKVSGRWCMILANDATVKAGAWFPITAKKNLRAQEIAMENRLPLIYLVDSAGVFLPMQDEIFPDKEHFGRMFRNNARLSSMGIPQIAAIMGACVAGGAYLPIMSDEALIVEKTGSIFLAGPYLVKAAIGEDTDNETLGGARTHCNISGVTDYKCANDQDALDKIRALVEKFGKTEDAGFDRVEPGAPACTEDEILQRFPARN